MIKSLVNKIIKNRVYLLIAIGIFLLSLLTLGRAYLQTTLSIVGNTKLTKNSWIIHFDTPIEFSDDSKIAIIPADIVDYGKTKMEFNVHLEQPGDLYEYTVWVVNDGTIDAMVDSVEKSELTEEQLKYLDFDVRYDTGEEIKRCDPLYGMETFEKEGLPHMRLIKVLVRFKDGIDLNNYPKDDVNLRLYFAINYVQLDDACPAQDFKDYKKLTIRPNGGTYEGRKAEQRVYLETGEEYTIKDTKRPLYNFLGWRVILPEENGTYTLNENNFVMGEEDVTIEAVWEEGNYVARIMDTYYPTIQEAFDDVDERDWEDNTVWLLKDTTEYPTNVTPDAFTFNLDGHTVTGTITNSSVGKITMVNGRVEAEADHNEAFINNGILNLGIHDGVVEVDNSIALVGNAYGLVNKKGAKFYFYDGYLQGVSGLVGGYTGKEDNHYVFVNHIHVDDKEYQKVYLVKNPNRAVAKTLTNGEHGKLNGDIYYYNLQDGIHTVEANKREIEELDDTDYILYAIRDFEAAYELEIDEDSRVFYDLVGYEMQVGKKIKNHGYFKMYNDKDVRTTIKPSMTIENDGELIVNNINILMTTDSVGINNTGKLDISDTGVHSKHAYAVSNTGNGEITFDKDTHLYADSEYGLYNASPNLVINHGTIVGFINDDGSGNVEITGDAKFNTYLYNYEGIRYAYGVLNHGVLKQTGAEIYSSIWDVPSVGNTGTYTLTAGSIDSVNQSVQNSIGYVAGTFNVEGGTITATNTTIQDGTINVRNDAELTSENGPASRHANLNIYSGKVYTDRTQPVINGNISVYGGELIGTDSVASGIGTFYIEGGKVTSDEGGITCSNAVIAGGLVDIKDTAISTSSLSMRDGLVISREETGIVVSSSALVTGGKIVGDIYGLRSLGELTIGEDEGTISSTVPEIVGGSFGLYIEGPITNFFDGILKGQIDGYNEEEYEGFTKGRITGTPLGGTIGEGTDTIDGNLYETDFIVAYENWIRIGDQEYNTINAASEACPENDECLMTVIKDSYTTFTQTFIDENNNKNITFDLNGHRISGTQTIINKSTVTIVDSSVEQTGTVEPDRVPIITNDNTMIINAGNYLTSNKASHCIINRQGEMTINHAKFRATTSSILNDAHLIINDVDMQSSNVCIDNGNYQVGYTLYSTGTIDMYAGTIKATNTAIRAEGSTIHIHGGLVEANTGISGSYGTLIVSGGKVHALTGRALENYWSAIEVHGGEVIADNSVAVQTASNTLVTGGYIEGTTGVEHKIMCSGNACWWNPETITGGKIVGTVNHGVVGHGSSLTITGGQIYGEIDGVQNVGADATIGQNEGSISTSVPLLQGKRYGLYTESYIRFFDGILKGEVLAHYGLISQIPDATMVKDDYEFINRVEYKTQYLVEFGDWLQVGDEKFNTLTDATAYAQEGDTIYVIADAYVAFPQSFPNDKELTFDLNGHQVIMTQSIDFKGVDTLQDRRGNGAITNLRDYAIVNNGNLTINKIILQSDVTYAIRNNGTMTINDIEINTTGGISNAGTLTIEDGNINGTSTYGINNEGTCTINGGYIHSDISTTIGNTNPLIINGGEIVNDNQYAIVSNCSAYHCGYIEVNGGEIRAPQIAIHAERGESSLLITGGHIQGTNGMGLKTISGNCHITGGVIEGTTYGVYTQGYTTLGTDDGTISIDLPVLKGDLYGLYIEQGTLNFYDGILKGITAANYGQITNIPNRAQIFTDEETINDNHYETKYLIMETDIAKNLNTGKIYSNLQDSLDEAQDNETVQLLTNVPLYYSVVNNNTHPFTLDLNGYTISTNKPITNNGVITITNNSETESFIKTSTAMTLITNTNTLYLGTVTIKNTSSDRYVVYNNNVLSLNGTKVEALNGVQNTNVATIKNSNFTCSYTTIDNSGEVKIDGGVYTGGSNAFYSNSYRESKVENATFNGNFNNNRGLVRANTITIVRNYVESLNNNGTLYLYNSEVKGDGLFNNAGTMEMEESVVNSTGTYRYDSRVSGISNSGSLKLIKSVVNMDKDESPCSIAYGITNTGTLNVTEESEINVGLEKNQGVTNYGILTNGNGRTTIDNSTININGGSTSYGAYANDVNTQITILTGEINVKNARVSYGAYCNYGKFTMGHFEGVEAESDLVSDTNPVVYAQGTTRGIGVKKVNGQFEFYDGIIWASRYAKPETTTLVEKLYEVTTYVDKDTGFEYAVLEYMGLDYQGKPTALLNGVYYQSLQDAIDVFEYAPEGSEIKLLKPISENINVMYGKKAVINLNSYSLTGKATNNGELQIFNGSLQSFDEEEIDEETGEVIPPVPTLINNGTFIMGQDDEKVSSTNIRIIGEGLAVNNTGTFIMYDGYIEGNPTIDGEIQQIADFARIHTVNEAQYERKYLQSLDENAIRRKETALILTVDPLDGFYDNQKGEQHYYLYYEDTMMIKKPTKKGCDFVRWEVSDPSAFELVEDPDGVYVGKITIDVKDIKLTAVWAVSERAKAKIGNEYYESLREALEAAKAGETVELLKDVEEDITVTKEVTIDLGGHTVTGAFINQGILTIKNGEIYNPDGTGLLNLKTLTMGVREDGEVDLDSVRIKGTEIGIEQNGRFNFYDGYIEGDVAMNGIAQSVPRGYSLYTEHNDSNNKQRLFLSGNPENAVASITSGEATQFFFKLTDAIASAKLVNEEIKIEKDFAATYEVTIPEDANIVINMNSHNMSTGDNIKNYGELLIYDNSETSGSITSAKSITNDGKMTIQGIKLHQNKSVDTLINNGELIVKDNIIDDVSYPAIIEATDKYAIINNGDLKLLGNYELNSNSYALNQNGTMNEVSTGKIHGIMWYKDTTLKDDVVITSTLSGRGGTLSLDGVTVDTPGDVCIYTYQSSNLTINVKNSTLNGSSGIYTDSGQNYGNITINAEDTKITATSYGVMLNTADTTFNSKNMDVTASSHAFISYGRRNVMDVEGSWISTTTTAIWDNEYKYDNNYSKMNIKNAYVEGAEYALYSRWTHITVENSELKNRVSNRDRYVIHTDGWTSVTLKDGAFINAPNSSGIWASMDLYMEDGARIYAGASNGYGIGGTWLGGKMSGGSIETPGSSSIGVYIYNDYANFTVDGASITSSNIGMYLDASNGNYSQNIYIKSGSIKGESYGIYMNRSIDILYIGDPDRDLSIEEPLISGGSYGIYKAAGVMNYYNGRLRGYLDGHNTDFFTLRDEHDYVTITERITENESLSTVSTTELSDSPVSFIPKRGHGAARLTFLDESNDVCDKNQEYTFEYTGSEITYSVPCTGKYKMEVWGATGGPDGGSYGGLGGYSGGDIELTQGEILYINVGGKGAGCVAGTGGGYNGGGNAGGAGCSGAGGGATHIATQSGLLKTLEDNKDSILIVAGGGAGLGGSANYSGSGGGYKGASSGGDGGTQQLPGSGNASGSFGQGGHRQGDGGGGGGGYYGGGASYGDSPGGGGSGYIGNSRLTNKLMVGYNVPSLPSIWIINYLKEKDMFLEVNGHTYNSIKSAIAALGDDATGTITMIDDGLNSEETIFPAGKTITFDLNGHKLKSTRGITNNGDLTIVDNSLDKTGIITSVNDTTIFNNGAIALDGITINTEGSYRTMSSSAGNGDVLIKDCTIKSGTNLYYQNGSASRKITVQNSNITTGGEGFRIDNPSNNNTVLIKDTTIDASGISVRFENSNSNNITITNSKLYSGDRAFYCYSQLNIINIDKSELISTGYAGLEFPAYNSNKNTLNISNSYVKGASYGALHRSVNATVDNTTYEKSGTNRDQYAFHSDYWAVNTFKNNSKIIATNGSGVYTTEPLTLEDSSIIAGASNAYGIVHNAAAVTLTDSSITCEGSTSIGYYANADNAYTITFNNIDIETGNVGLYIYGAKTINFNSGTINGAVTGVYVDNSGLNFNIGDKESTLSTENPLIKSDNVAISKNRGKVNFYSGRITAGTIVNTSDFDVLRTDMQVKYDYNYTEGEMVVLSVQDHNKEAITNVPKEGNGYAKLTLVENYDTEENASYNEVTNVTYSDVDESLRTRVIDYDYTGSPQTFKVPYSGNYKIELWGGSGTAAAAYGGYTSGDITLTADQELYFYVGNYGTSGTNKVTFNNGTGNAGGYNGGGATDVRLTSGNWDNFDSLKSRIMVAGAGGSGDKPGAAGGLVGYNGNGTAGGTQTTFGTAQLTSYTTSSFGIANGGCTGGGGYYPGGGASCANGGGGGSSYISGHQGCNSIAKTSISTNVLHTGDIVHYSGYKFTNTSMVDGKGYEWVNGAIGDKVDMPSFTSDGTMAGNAGAGHARITYLLNNDVVKVRLVNDFNHTSREIQLNSGDQLGDITADSISGQRFVGWFLDNLYTKIVSSTTTISSNTYLYAYYVPAGEYCDSIVNQPIEFNYTGEVVKFTTSCFGKYKMEVWGAQGGNAGGENVRGGYGGYTSGYIVLNGRESIYITVGQEGLSNTNYNNATVFNGGGAGYTDATNTFAGSGGGATHIATVSGELNTLSNNKDSILIVAGGGGGASQHDTRSITEGGSGGGLTGANGSSWQWAGGTGGTQTAGGSGGNGGLAGSFGKGGDGRPNAGGGGGGGYYGGGGGCGGSGGGGSSYVNATRVTDGYMTGYNINGSGFDKIDAYLVVKEGFLEVNGTIYNSFSAAIAALTNKKGTIKVVADAIVTDATTIPEEYDVILDLNGHRLNTSQLITNNGSLTIDDSSDGTGEIINNATTLLANNGTLVVNKARIIAKNCAINGIKENSTITVNKDTYITGSTGISINTKQKLYVNGTRISASTYGIYNEGNGTEIKITYVDIQSAYFGIRLQNHNSKLYIDDCNIDAQAYAIYNYGQSNYILIKDGFIKSRTSHAIINESSYNTSYLPELHIEGGLIESPSSTLYLYYITTYIKNAEIRTTSTSRDSYAIYSCSWGGGYIQEGAFINAPKASGIRTEAAWHLQGGRIYAGAVNAFGLYSQYNNFFLESGSIEAPGINANGIYAPDTYEFQLNMSGGSITAGNAGLYLANPSNRTRTTTITGGTIKGGSYGIYQVQGHTTTIGDSVGNVSITDPYIEGGLYGVYKTSGSLSFYSGKLKGTVGAYYGSFNNIREDYEVFETTDTLTAEELRKRTISTDELSAEAESKKAKLGNGYARVTYINNDTGKIVTDVDNITDNSIGISNITNIPYTGSEYVYTVDRDGEYELRVWGASGGDATGYYHTYTGGYGGYSSGKVTLSRGEKLYIHVGGEGDDIKDKCVITENASGYNGGGRAACQGAAAYGTNYNNYLFAGGGGGATHISTKSGKLSELETYKGTLSINKDYYISDDILIVAGGGGGAHAAAYQYGFDHVANGGNGGGYAGTSGETAPASSSYWGGNGGTQIMRGRSNTYSNATWTNDSQFGLGCNPNESYSGGLKAAGGGGFYGGGCGNHSGGGGGSGYIASSQLTDAHMTCYNCGNTDNPAMKTNTTDKVSTSPTVDFAKEGNGYAQIIYLGSEPADSNEIYYIKLSSDKGTIADDTLVYNYDDELGDIPAPVVTDENYEFAGWFLDKEFTKKVSSTTTVNANATLYAKFTYRNEYCTSLINNVNNFDYTGGEQTLDITCPGTYKLEVWGAQGGGTNPIPDGMGAGGYSVGTIQLDVNERLYINVGGAGPYGSGPNRYGGPYGGYNGGGNGGNSGSGAGGGATHIATASGVLESLVSNKESVLIVAGGGGGTDDSNVGSETYVNDGAGGSGGGFRGGEPKVTSSITSGYGATQETGYMFGRGRDASNTDTGGGGGGWYGGYSTNNNNGGAGGGSGYTGNPRLSDTYMYTYKNYEGYINSNVAWLIPVTDKVINTTTNVKYTNIQTAIDNALDEDVLEVLGNGNIAYELVIPAKKITLDLHGYTVTTNKTITNNGNFSIVDLTNSGTSALNNTVTSSFIINNNILSIDGINMTGNETINNKSAGTLTVNNTNIVNSTNGIVNAGTLNIDTVNIHCSSYGINNTGTMTIKNIGITGGSYGIYNNSIQVSTVNNSSIESSTAIYLASSGKLLFTGSYKSIGTVNVQSSTATLTINPNPGATLSGTLGNNGKLSIKNTNISYTVNTYGNYTYFTNNGDLTFDTVKLTFTETYTGGTSNYDLIIYNKGTMTSVASEYNYVGTTRNDKHGWLIENYAIFKSTNDKLDMSGTNYFYGFYNNSSNTTEVRNIDINLHQSTYSYGIYSAGGAATITGGIVRAEGTYAYGMVISNSTVTSDGVTFDINATNTAYGIYTENEGAKIRFNSGTINSTGPTAYGIYMVNGVTELGITEDGVSTTNPSIKATGTTTGIGVSMGNGDFYYYDGKISGTTGYIGTNDIITREEDKYKEYPGTEIDPDTEIEYNYCVLGLMM